MKKRIKQKFIAHCKYPFPCRFWEKCYTAHPSMESYFEAPCRSFPKIQLNIHFTQYLFDMCKWIMCNVLRRGSMNETMYWVSTKNVSQTSAPHWFCAGNTNFWYVHVGFQKSSTWSFNLWIHTLKFIVGHFTTLIRTLIRHVLETFWELLQMKLLSNFNPSLVRMSLILFWNL